MKKQKNNNDSTEAYKKYLTSLYSTKSKNEEEDKNSSSPFISCAKKIIL